MAYGDSKPDTNLAAWVRSVEMVSYRLEDDGKIPNNRLPMKERWR